MADETHQGLRKGAADGAPTAPHAEPRPASDAPRGFFRSRFGATGPERFWNARRMRWAMAAAALLSLTVHFWLSPWTFRSGVTFETREIYD